MESEKPTKSIPRDSHERTIVGRTADKMLAAKKLKDYRKAVFRSNIGRARRGEPLRGVDR